MRDEAARKRPETVWRKAGGQHRLMRRSLIIGPIAMWVAMVADLPALELSTLNSQSAFSYDSSTLNNPYLRTNNFYGFDRMDSDDAGGLAGLFGDIELPLITNLGISPFYNDNVLYNNDNRKSAFGSNFAPTLILPFGSRKIYTVFSYSLNANVYEGLSYANTTSNFLNSTTSVEFDHRNHLTLSARGTPYAQDALGTYFSQGNVANTLKTPNTWTGYGFDANYRYGSDTSEGNILLNFSMNDRLYQNNPEYTRYRSLNNYTFGGAFLWRALPKTQFLLETDATILDYFYPNSAGNILSGDLYRAYTGVTWEATAKTRIVVKGGYQVRTYTDPHYQTQSGPGFQAMLRWQPAARDTVWLEAMNALNEAYIGSSTAINTQNYSLNWGHSWLERFRTQLTGTYVNQDYTNSSIQYQTYYGSISGIYTIQQGMWLDLRYNYSNRAANGSQNSQYNYDQNLLLFSYRMMF